MGRKEEERRVFMAGRRTEIRLLHGALEDCAHGGTVRCLVTGEPGIGRTTLLRAFSSASLAQGCRTVALLCDPQDHDRPLILAQRFLADLAVLLPPDHQGRACLESALRPGAAPHLKPGSAPGPLSASLPAVRTALADLTTEAPLVITLDDADQADAASLDFLRRALAGPPATRVLLVLSAGEVETGGDAPRFGALLDGARHGRMTGLTRTETAALLEHELRLTPRPRLVEECHRVSAGNPFMLVEIARLLRERPSLGQARGGVAASAPAAVARLVGNRLTRIDPNALKVATAIALAGGDTAADPLLVAHLSRLSLHQTLAATDLLVRTRLVEDDDRLVLRHRVVHNALLGRMTLMARNAAHLAAATYLHGKHAPVERIVHHLTASTVALDDAWPVPVLLLASRGALAAREPEKAGRYLEHAVKMASGAERRSALLELTDVRMRIDLAGGLDQAIRTVEEVTAAGEPGRGNGSGTTRGSAADGPGAPFLARISSALCLRAPSGETVPPATALARRRLSGWPQLHRMLDCLRDRPPLPAARPGEDLLVPNGDPAYVLDLHGPDQGRAAAAAVAALRGHLDGDDVATTLRRTREALRADDALCLYPLLAMTALMTLVWNGRDEEAMAYLRLHQECVRCQEHPLHRALLLPVTARMALMRGRLRVAHDELGECLDALVRYGTRPMHPLLVWVVGMLADVRLSLGLDAEARALLREHGCLGGLPHGWLHRDLLVTRARLRSAGGDLAGAARDLGTAERGVTAGPAGTGTPRGATAGVHRYVHTAEVLTQLGRNDEAVAVATELTRAAEAVNTPRERGVALRVLGSVQPERGRAEPLLREAVRLLAETGAAYDLAHATADLACLLFDEGRHDEASGELTRALELADRCGARPLVTRLRQRLGVAEERAARRSPLGGVLTLTRRENQILIDAVRGLTNEHIASNLHITRRTVELHLSSAYRKLGITGRKDFPHLFRTTGLWPLLLDAGSST
ncbi:AAA family ATPase [Streptomyces sp. NPDC056987]|uniref:helix-turn-helix transcriptional regulator n=1 Tax=Streptomyces sp. NPDC056987 TaxID=3345988 RepID=UPI00362DDD50